MTSLAEQLNIVISFLHPLGTFLITNTPLADVNAGKPFDPEEIGKKVLFHVYIEEEGGIEGNYDHGLRQLTEIAIKALSPGINDPGTAVESLRSITELLSYRLNFHPSNLIKDSTHQVRVVTIEKSFEDLLRETFLPIWDHGKNDRFVQHEMKHLLTSLLTNKHNDFAADLLQKVKARMMSS